MVSSPLFSRSADSHSFSQALPKWLLLAGAALAFFHLFSRNLPPPTVAQPLRVDLLHAELAQKPSALFAAGLALPSPLELARTPRVSRLTSPLGTENGSFTYNARPFGEVDHLGDDLNGIGGEDSDLGDPVYAIGAGVVVYAGAASEGWGNVVLLQHRQLGDGRMFQSFYAHLDSIQVALHDPVQPGQVLGTVGNASGKYLAHLHFEIRDGVSLGAGVGYHPLRLDRQDPSLFLREHRNASETHLLPGLHTIAPPLPANPAKQPLSSITPPNPSSGKLGAREPRQ